MIFALFALRSMLDSNHSNQFNCSTLLYWTSFRQHNTKCSYFYVYLMCFFSTFFLALFLLLQPCSHFFLIFARIYFFYICWFNCVSFKYACDFYFLSLFLYRWNIFVFFFFNLLTDLCARTLFTPNNEMKICLIFLL